MRKGWFKIAGVQNGDRTIEQQMLGLGSALVTVRQRVADVGKCSLLDLGCAEGLVSREFAAAGAAPITCVEVVADSALEAKKQCPKARVVCEDLDKFVLHGIKARHDVVLALAILHKLWRPERLLAFMATNADLLMVIRTAGRTPGYIKDDRSDGRRIDLAPFLEARGWRLDRTEAGPFDEWMGYFVKAA